MNFLYNADRAMDWLAFMWVKMSWRGNKGAARFWWRRVKEVGFVHATFFELRAFKGTRDSMKCLDMQYELGCRHVMFEKPVLCDTGFHACVRLENVFNHYPFYGGNRFFEVAVSFKGRIVFDTEKLCCTDLTVVRELDAREIKEMSDSRLVSDYSWRRLVSASRRAAGGSSNPRPRKCDKVLRKWKRRR